MSSGGPKEVQPEQNIPRPEMSRSSSSVLDEYSVSLSTTSSICDSRMILISCPRLDPGFSRFVYTRRVSHHFTAWFLTSEILSSTNCNTCPRTLSSTDSSPRNAWGSCLISFIRSLNPIYLFERRFSGRVFHTESLVERRRHTESPDLGIASTMIV